jgi:hypothetical protein
VFNDFALKSGKGRAFAKIRQAISPHAALEHARLTGKRPILVCSILKPSDCVAEALDESSFTTAELRSMEQDCVIIDAGVIGRLPNSLTASSGFWSLIVPDHAIGRVFQYSRMPDPAAAIRELHTALLWAPASLGQQQQFNDDQRGVWIRAGDGAFICHMKTAVDAGDNNRYGTFVVARTFVDDDRLREGQGVTLERAAPGDRMGDTWLAPDPLRTIVKTDKGVRLRALPWWR